MNEPTEAVTEATTELMRAASKFARACLDQYAAEMPSDAEAVAARFVDGTAEMVVVVSTGPGGTAQLCADVGSQRHVVCTVPTQKPRQH